MLPTIRPATKDDHADETDDEMLGGEETDERANLLGGGNKEAGGEDDDFFLNGPKVKISGLRSQVDQVTRYWFLLFSSATPMSKGSNFGER